MAEPHEWKPRCTLGSSESVWPVAGSKLTLKQLTAIPGFWDAPHPEGIDMGVGDFEDSNPWPPSAEPGRNLLLLWLVTLLFKRVVSPCLVTATPSPQCCEAVNAHPSQPWESFFLLLFTLQLKKQRQIYSNNLLLPIAGKTKQCQ